VKSSAPSPGRRQVRVVRNLRVLVAAPARSPRCQADAHRVAARLTELPRVTPLPSPTQPAIEPSGSWPVFWPTVWARDRRRGQNPVEDERLGAG
jgi:hypothetical protein